MTDLTRPLVIELAQSFAYDDDQPPFEFLDVAVKASYESQAAGALAAVFDVLHDAGYMLADVDENGPRDRCFDVLAEQVREVDAR